MLMMKFIGLLILLFSIGFTLEGKNEKIVPGAERPEKYLSLLQGKNVGLVVNHTSVAEGKHFVDFLLEKKVRVKKIFAPEHGFRGDASDGAKIEDGIDSQTGLPVFSLYGKTKKPTKEHLQDLDVVIFDIQDVGCRFYTYISTLHYVMEACAENSIPVIVMDRPNPNGDYVAGPVLEMEFQSFVGMHPIPVVHGLTVGELALMINGENWLKGNAQCKLDVIKVEGYTHKDLYQLPIQPSPNLPNQLAVRLYPSLCFFEATTVSVGRGTDFPFQVLGGLRSDLGDFQFTPRSIPGVSLYPPNKGKICTGIDLRELDEVPLFTIKYLLDFYSKYENEKDFLIRESWLGKLAGTDNLIKQVREGKTEEEIHGSWKPQLIKYKQLRKKYLLYPDFE